MLSQFELRPLTSGDEDKVLTFIDEWYTKENAALFGLQKKDLADLNKFRVKQRLKENLSVGWFHKSSNMLVAVGVNTIVKKSRTASVEFYEANGLKLSQGAKDYLTLLERLEVNLFDKAKSNQVFYGCFAAIHPQYRSLGLLRPMFAKLYKIGNDLGFKYTFGTTSDEKVINSNEKAGGILINEIKFSEYIDPKTGRNPFELLQPKASRIRLYCGKNSSSNL